MCSSDLLLKCGRPALKRDLHIGHVIQLSTQAVRFGHLNSTNGTVKLTRAGTMPSHSSPSVLLLGAYRQTPAFARALRRVGFGVRLASEDPTSPEASSNAIEERVVLPPVAHESSWIDALCEEFVRDKSISHVFPIGEAEIAALGEYREALPRYVSEIGRAHV